MFDIWQLNMYNVTLKYKSSADIIFSLLNYLIILE